MNVIPKCKAEWLRLFVLPFHIYVFAVFLCIQCLGAAFPYRRKYGFPYELYGLAFGLILLGYVLCFFVLVGCGIYCVRCRGGDGAFSSFASAAFALLFAYVLFPPLAAP